MTRPTQPALHDCPGHCGRRVARHQLACQGCWRRLPQPMRQRLDEAYRAQRRTPTSARVSEHRKALAAALDWYRDNPPARRP